MKKVSNFTLKYRDHFQESVVMFSVTHCNLRMYVQIFYQESITLIRTVYHQLSFTAVVSPNNKITLTEALFYKQSVIVITADIIDNHNTSACDLSFNIDLLPLTSEDQGRQRQHDVSLTQAAKHPQWYIIWEMKNGYGFYGHVPRYITWIEANDTCNRIGGQLPIFRQHLELKYLEDII